MTSEEKRVTPLANDPESIQEYATSLGLDPRSMICAEVFSLDEEMAAFVPHPVYSVIFLYPVGDEDGVIEKRYTEKVPLPEPTPWFTYQTVSNACGTIAVVHSIMNNLDKATITSGSWFENFISQSMEMSPEQRAELIYNDKELEQKHEEHAQASDVDIPDNVDTHYIAFVKLDGKLWELDGRKPQQICHGDCDDLLLNSLNVIKNDFMPHITDPLRISIAAFCAPSQ